MWYIYQENNNWVYTQDKPQHGEYTATERMPPMPVQEGFEAVLCANVEAGLVWYELIETLDGARTRKLASIAAYDQGPEVNGFRIGDASMWLDRDTRVSLSRTIGIEAAAGALTTTIWYNDATPPVCFELPIEAAQQMLSALEMYAKECFNITQAHKAAVYALDTREAIEAYDHTTEYPEQLTFNLS